MEFFIKVTEEGLLFVRFVIFEKIKSTMRSTFTLLFFSFLFSSSLFSQNTPFSRGVNLTQWFQAGSAQEIQFSKYTRLDFEQIQSLGCDVIRLPINLHFMTNGAPDYSLDPLFLNFLDQVVDWAEELNMHLILDNHTFDPAANTDPNVGTILEKVWLQMAEHFKERSNLIYYEILNEPHGISHALWNAIQQDVVAAIRTVDDTHTIIVGGAEWNSFYALDEMPVYTDDNLIYTFHFYDPFLFTHQGASWVEPSLVPLANVPFPYNAATMPDLPASFNGTWIQSAYNNYANEGNEQGMEELLGIAVQFREEREVPIFCGEFGVLMDNSDNEDRVFWYEKIVEILETNNIGWTMWDYHGGFGLFEPGSDGLFDHDLNVPLLQALGFNVPPQTPFSISPDSTGFFIYTDYIASQIYESSYNSGVLRFYSEDLPNNDNYCIRWGDVAQYNNIGFDFRPDRDLSYLESEGYALDFFVRGDTPGTEFDVRFIDSDTDDPEDHPWRIRTIIDENDAAWDGYWHHLHIPLSTFTEHGAWEDNTWYNPQGAFDWSAIDRFEIVAEGMALDGANFWFDHIQITELDTALVNETGVFSNLEEVVATIDLSVFPNPVQDVLAVNTTAAFPLDWQLVDSYGRLLQQGRFFQNLEIDMQQLPNGIYFLKYSDGESRGIRKVVK